MHIDDTTRPLWTCPQCGHRFATRNLWHSCLQHKLDEHFKGKDTRLRALFNVWLEFIKQFGEVTIVPQRSRISFQTRVRFAGAVIHKECVECAVWLKRPVQDERFQRMEKLTARDYIYYFHLTDESQLDETMKEYLHEAYEVGCQKVR